MRKDLHGTVAIQNEAETTCVQRESAVGLQIPLSVWHDELASLPRSFVYTIFKLRDMVDNGSRFDPSSKRRRRDFIIIE